MAELIKQYKFSHVRAAYAPLAQIIAGALPSLDSSWCVTAIPTVAAHVRERGYDQALLMARAVTKYKGVTYVHALQRVHNVRQIGANRQTRQAQMKGEFAAIRPKLFTNRKVLIIDDVCTTGSTLAAAAEVLKRAGAAEAWGAVAAWKR